MANIFRFDSSASTNSLKKGRASIAINEELSGSKVGFFNGLVPPDGGYLVYHETGANQSPSIRVFADDAQLIFYASKLSGSSFTTIGEALDYFRGQNDKLVVNKNIENIITEDLVFMFDPSFVSSYPLTGSTTYDLSQSGNNPTLTNGATYSSGYIELDGVNDHLSLSSGSLPNGDSTTLAWVWVDSTGPSNSSYSGVVCWGDRGNYNPSEANLLSINTGSGATWYVSSAYWYNDWVPNTLPIVKDAWNFVGKIARAAGTVNNTTLISGTSTSTGSSSSYSKGLSLASNSLTIGCTDNGGGRPIKGKMGRVLIYDRELTTAEILRNYYLGPIRTSNMVYAIDAANLCSNETATTINDLTSNGNGFTYEGTVSKSDAFGGCLRLNSGRIYRAAVSWYGNYTLGFWMKYVGSVSATQFYTESNRSPSGCYRVSSYLNANGTFTYRVWDNSSHSAGIGGTRTTTTTTNVCDGDWHYVTVIWSNGSSNQTAGVYVFVDGEQEGYQTMVGNDGTYAHIHLGGSYGCVGDYTHNCYLGPIHQYSNYAMSSGEVRANYNAYQGRYNDGN